MTKTTKMLTSVALMIALMIGSTAAYAQNGEGGQNKYIKNPEVHAQIMEAMENRDYDTWVSLLPEDGKGAQIHEYINEENFDTFVDMKEAFQNKDFETAKEIHEELGLPEMPNKGNKNGHKGQFGPKDPEKAEAIKGAMEAGDYEAWTAILTEDGREAKILEHINADNFGQFVEMTQAMRNHDFETARAIHEELGLPMPPKGQHKGPQGQGMGHFKGELNGLKKNSNQYQGE